MSLQSNNRLIIRFISVCTFVSILLSGSSFALTYTQYSIIQIAFQHGYKYAMKLSEKEYLEIKNKPELLRRKAVQASIQYLDIVDKLN